MASWGHDVLIEYIQTLDHLLLTVDIYRQNQIQYTKNFCFIYMYVIYVWENTLLVKVHLHANKTQPTNLWYILPTACETLKCNILLNIMTFTLRKNA